MEPSRDERRSDSPETAAPPPRRASRLAIAAVAAFLAVLSVAGYKTWRDLVTVESRADELRGEIVQIEGEIDALEEQRDRLREDPVTLERVAREELHMVHPDDVVVVLPVGEEREDASPP
jgi:cell division protein FtsB